MSVFDRAREDEARGDLGSARNRLAAYAASTGFDSSTCEQVARLSIRMKDPIEAGRWYFLCDSADQEAEEAIGRFVRSCGDQPTQVVAALPRGIRVRSDWPGAVADRLRAVGFKEGQRRVRRAPRSAGGKVRDLLLLLAVAALLACTLIGVRTVLSWIFKAG